MLVGLLLVTSWVFLNLALSLLEGLELLLELVAELLKLVLLLLEGLEI